MTELEDAMAWGERCWINLVPGNIRRIRLLAAAARLSQAQKPVCSWCGLQVSEGDVHSSGCCTVMMYDDQIRQSYRLHQLHEPRTSSCAFVVENLDSEGRVE